MFLYISDRTQRKNICKALSDRGFFLYSSPYETALFLCEKKDTGGVIVDCIPDPRAGVVLCEKLRLTYPDMPIAAIVPSEAALDLKVDLLLRDAAPQVLTDRIADFFVHRCDWIPKVLSTHALTIDIGTHTAHYAGYPLSLTAVEFRILYCLFYRSPRPTPSDDLLSLCYFGRMRSISNIGVQIHNINQKAARIDPRPLVIHTTNGYRLRDGILR